MNKILPMAFAMFLLIKADNIVIIQEETSENRVFRK